MKSENQKTLSRREDSKMSLVLDLLSCKSEEVVYLKEVLTVISRHPDVPTVMRNLAGTALSNSMMVALGLTERQVEISPKPATMPQALICLGEDIQD